MGVWKIIQPVFRENYIKNPAAMGAGNYAPVSSTVMLDTTKAYLGYRNFKVFATEDNDGITLSMGTLTNYNHYVTVRHYGAIPSAWDWSVNGANFSTPALLGIEGDWYVYGHEFSAALCNGATTLYIYKNGAGAFTWYIGHVQVEAGAFPTTPITGDMKGFAMDGYVWLGEPNASVSKRYWYERSGGYEVDIEDTYGFTVLYGLGTGMPPVQHNVQPLALLPGALYTGHSVLPRVLDLVSAAKSNTTAGISLARSNFINVIKPDKVYPEQPVVIRYYGVNANRPVEFHAVYDSGMEFQTSSGKIDKPVARFICYDPFVYETHTEGKELVRYIPIADADYVVKRLDGVWTNISTAFNAEVRCFTLGKDGCIYIGGYFSNVGDVNGDYIVKYNPVTNTISSLGTGLAGGACLDLLTAPNGDIYAGGAFTSAGGVANTAYIAKWQYSTQTWVSLSATALSTYVYTLALGLDGTLYVGGNFTNAGGVANADYICRWTGTDWAAVGDVLGADNYVNSIMIAPNGDLYMTGGFHAVNSITVNHIAKYVGTPSAGTWSAMGTGLSASGVTLKIAENGLVYVGGLFVTANGVTVNYIAIWNGVTFLPMGSGANNTVYRIRIDSHGHIYAGGLFTTIGGLSVTDRLARWNGSTWYPIPVNLPGDPIVYDFCFVPRTDDIYIGYNTAGTAYASAITNVVVSNSGSHSTYPKIGINRADDGTGCLIKYIRNLSTRQNLYLNYELQKGESITIDLKQGDKSVVSSYYGPILRAILRGSDFSEFCLLGGTNVISVYVTEAGSPTMMAWIEYKLTHWAADTVAV